MSILWHEVWHAALEEASRLYFQASTLPPHLPPTSPPQAALVSTELIRVSILWHEVWHAALEEASHLYFQASDADAMLAALAPLHAQLTSGAQTATEQVSARGGRFQGGSERGSGSGGVALASLGLPTAI